VDKVLLATVIKQTVAALILERRPRVIRGFSHGTLPSLSANRPYRKVERHLWAPLRFGFLNRAAIARLRHDA